MKNISILLLLIGSFASCQLAPCITKDSFISASNQTSEKFNKNQDKFSDTDWELMDNQYQNYLTDCYPKYEKELTNTELKHFWLTTTQYFIKRSYKGPEMNKELQDLYGDHFAKYLETMGSKFADKFKNIMDINVDNAVDKIFNFIDKYGEEKEK